MRPSQTSFARFTARFTLVLLLTVAFATPANAQQQCSDTQFVQRVFGDLLFRAPDNATLSFYTPLASSVGRQAVAASLVGSQEYAANIVGGNPTVVAGFYQKYLGHNPQLDDVTFWVGKEPIKDGAIMAMLMNSTEYSIRASGANPAIGSTKSRLINQIMLDLLGRNATSGELSFYSAQTAQNIALGVMATDEYNTRVIQQSFQRMLHRAASSSEVTFYLNALKTSSRPDEDLLAALAGSGEYCNGAVQSPTFGFVAPSDTYFALNTLNVPSNVNTLPAVQLGPVDAAANFQILALGIQAASATDTSALQQQIAALQAQVAADNSTIASLQSQLASLQAQSSSDAATITSLQSQLTSTQQQLADANTTINSLQSQVNSLTSQLATANGTISGQQTQINSLTTQLATANSTISGLQGQLSTANGTITALQTQVSGDALTIASLQSTVASLTSQLNAAADKIAEQEKAIADFASALLGQMPSREVAMAVGNFVQVRVDQANGPMVREARAAMNRGNAKIEKGDYDDAVRAFRLAYLLVGNGDKHELAVNASKHDR